MRRIIIGGFLLSILMSLSLPLSHAQLPPADSIRGLAQSFLIQQLGYEPTLVEFTFEGRTWEDTSLGCPVAGQSYEKQQIAGYQWKFLMGDGVRYAIHTDVYGTQLILCPATSEAVLTYSTYNSQFFSINHPNIWSAQQVSPTQVDFNFRGESACPLPEMRILILANYADSASILDAYYTGLGLPADRNNYVPILDKGLTTIHTLDCGGSARKYQATGVIGGTSTSYLILQSAPANLFDIWSSPFVEMVNSFVAGNSPVASGANLGSAGVQPPTPTPVVQAMAATVMPTATAGLPDPVSAITVPTLLPSPTATIPPTAPLPPLVPEFDVNLVPLAHIFLGDIYIGRLNDLAGRGVTRQPATRDHLRVTRDGLQLSYLENGSQLYTVSLLDPQVPNLLSEEVVGDFPPAWGFEQSALAYVTDTGAEVTDNTATYAIQAIYPDGTRETVGEIPFRMGCEVNSSYVIDQLYWSETGINGNGIILEWLPNNRFLYSTGCDGVGLAIFDKNTGEHTPLAGDLRRASLSPERGRLAAITPENGLVVVDLTTLESRAYTTSAPLDQLNWDVTGTQIFYSTLFPAEPQKFEEASFEAQAREVLGVFPYESRLNTIRIFQVDTQNQLEVKLWEGTGFAVGQLRGSPDGKGLVFTLIPSDRGWLTNFINQVPRNVLRNSVPETELYWVTSITQTQIEAGAARLLAFTTQPIFGVAPSSPAEVTPTP